MKVTQLLLISAVLVAVIVPSPGYPQGTSAAQGKVEAGASHVPSEIDRLITQIEDAKKSNDVTKMRSALDQAEGALAMFKDQMAMCSEMMGCGMGAMMNGQKPKKGAKKPPAPEGTDHSQHH